MLGSHHEPINFFQIKTEMKQPQFSIQTALDFQARFQQTCFSKIFSSSCQTCSKCHKKLDVDGTSEATLYGISGAATVIHVRYFLFLPGSLFKKETM